MTDVDDPNGVRHEDGHVQLQQRPLLDRITYFAEQLAAARGTDRLDVVATVASVNLPGIVDELRQALSGNALDPATTDADQEVDEHPFGRVTRFVAAWNQKIRPDIVTRVEILTVDGPEYLPLYASDLEALVDPDEAGAEEMLRDELNEARDELRRLRAEPKPSVIATDFRKTSEQDIRKWREAVATAVGRTAMPDDQPAQGERDAASNLDEVAARVGLFLDTWRAVMAQSGVPFDYVAVDPTSAFPTGVKLLEDDLGALLDEREQLRAERVGDAHVVAKVIAAANRHARGDSLTQLHQAIDALEQRFDDRWDLLEADATPQQPEPTGSDRG